MNSKKEKNFLEIIQKRKDPGIIIFDDKGDVLCFNEEISKVVSSFQDLPAILKRLYIHVKNNPKTKNKYALLNIGSGKIFSLRALTLNVNEKEKKYVAILVERIAEKPINLNKIKKNFNLTERELQVLKFICEGLSNKEIASRLYISEYTVKDHIKKIMKKLNVSSRSEIIASLLNSGQKTKF